MSQNSQRDFEGARLSLHDSGSTVALSKGVCSFTKVMYPTIAQALANPRVLAVVQLSEGDDLITIKEVTASVTETPDGSTILQKRW